MTAPSFSSFPDLEPSSCPQSAKEPETTGNSKHKEKKHRSDKERGEYEEKDKRRERNKREKRKEKRLEHDDGRSSRDEHGHSLKHHKRPSVSYNEGQGLSLNEKGATASEGYNRFFYQDRKGDELNITYGSLHAGDIPKYWHVGHGRKVLGLESNLAILYRGSKGVEIGEPAWYNRVPQLTDSRARALLSSGQTRRLTASAKTLLKYEEIDGFVRVPSRKGKEKNQEYRSITRDGEDDSDSESSSQSGSDSSDSNSDTSPMSAREESLRSLEQRLAKDPTSLPSWLLLLQHSINGITPSSKNAETARAEISVSILGRALSAHPSNARSALLRLKCLKAGESIWEVKRMDEEWEEALKAIGSADMYVEWLDWAMRATPRFSVVVEDAIKAISLITAGGSLVDENADFANLRIFWRIATFFRQAGYVERGFALLQAQAELSFNIPEEDKKAPFEEQLNSLEIFWESEAPRVGEARAKGWKTWKINKKGDSGRKPGRIGEYDSGDPYEVWHFYEAQSDKCLIFPTRMPSKEGSVGSEDEGGYGYEGAEDEEDPYATVLFSDIRPFLIDLRTVKGRDMFRLIWLQYLGLHIPGLSNSLSTTGLASDDRWADTPFLKPSLSNSFFPRTNMLRTITADSYTGVTVGREKKYEQSFDAIKSWSMGVLGPLEGLTVDGEHRMWSRGCLSGVDSDISDAISHIFKELRYENDDLQWDITGLAFESLSPRCENALRRSQVLLSENSSSVELLASHAYLERIRQNYEKARKVYRVGLQSLAQSKEHGVVCLWWGSAELEWLLSKSDAALEVVLRAGGQQNDRASVDILRAKRRLEEFCQQSAVPEWRFRLNWIRLRVLLEFLIGTLNTAIEISERLLASEETGSLQHESLTVASLFMVYHHTVTLRNHAPPAVLRELVRTALDTYPSNSIILGLFLECEKGEGVWGRVRALLSENVPGALRDKTVARRLAEVWIANWEGGRWLGEVERVRAGLEAAVTSDRTKGSAILWKVYVEFEIAAGNVKRAKAVLFRALGDCPLVKELYLLAFDGNLRPAYSRRELMDLSDTMAERGIRLRHSLGELLETYGVDVYEGETETDGSAKEHEDEQEYESRELRRLMPY